MQLAEQLVHHAGAARADAASEFAIDATHAAGNRPGRCDPIGGTVIKATATVATVIPIARHIDVEELARHGEIQRNTSQINTRFGVGLAILSADYLSRGDTRSSPPARRRRYQRHPGLTHRHQANDRQDRTLTKYRSQKLIHQAHREISMLDKWLKCAKKYGSHSPQAPSLL